MVKEKIFIKFKRCELTFEEMKELYSYSNKSGIDLFFSAFDRETVRQAHSICPHLFKISSMDLSNFEACDEASKLYKNIIMSTGMSTLEDIKKSSNFINERVSKENITLLHCVSSYPMDISSISLGTIKNFDNFQELDIVIILWTQQHRYFAAAYGAKVIEKHITIDKELPGPDHIHSLIPEELNSLVENLHNFASITSSRKGIIELRVKSIEGKKRILL